MTNESTEHNQALKQEVECSLTSPNVSITTNLTGNTSSLTQQEEAGRHNCAFIPINEKKIVNGSLEEASPRSPSKVLEDLSNPDLYVLDGINQCIANDSKNFEPSCSDSPSEQLSKILASMRGRMVEENARKRLNFNAGSCMDNNSHNNEFQDGCNEQFCRVSISFLILCMCVLHIPTYVSCIYIVTYIKSMYVCKYTHIYMPILHIRMLYATEMYTDRCLFWNLYT